MQENELTDLIINKAIKIHHVLGPGLLESVYEQILSFELEKEGLKIERQRKIPVRYENLILDVGFRTDILVNEKVIVELKSIETILPVHKSNY